MRKFWLFVMYNPFLVFFGLLATSMALTFLINGSFYVSLGGVVLVLLTWILAPALITNALLSTAMKKLYGRDPR